MAEPKKQESLDYICGRLGLPKMNVGYPGSSVPAAVFHGAAAQFGIDTSGQMPVVAERIAAVGGQQWTKQCDSRHTKSKGGSTVTRTGMRVLAEAIDVLIDAQLGAAGDDPIGLPYVQAQGGINADPTFTEQDWAALDKATLAHAGTQNELAAFLETHGLTPLSPLPGGPRFDIAWRCSTGFIVAEVKTVLPTNHAQQCRLGIGQVIEYREVLRHAEPSVTPILVTSADPLELYRTVCSSVGVIATWVETYAEDLGPLLTPP